MAHFPAPTISASADHCIAKVERGDLLPASQPSQ
jgi:hypothetical protein